MEELTKEQQLLVFEEAAYVRSVAIAMSNEMRVSETVRDEIISDAYYALCKLVKTYDKQIAFHYYVMTAIRYRIFDEIRFRFGRQDARRKNNVKWSTTHPIYLSQTLTFEEGGETAFLDSLLGGEVDYGFSIIDCVDEINEILDTDLFDSKIREIVYRRLNGESMIKISMSMGISESRVSQILKPFKEKLKTRWFYSDKKVS